MHAREGGVERLEGSGVIALMQIEPLARNRISAP